MMFKLFVGLPATIKSSIGLVTIVIILLFIFWLQVKKVKPEDKTPKWLVPFITLVSFINQFLKKNIGKNWKPFGAMILTMGIFIFLSNTASIFGIASPTSYVVVTASFAVFSFLIIQIGGIASCGLKRYLKGIASPWPLTPINLIGEFALPLALCLRLFGNMLSGAVLGTLLTGLLGWYSIPVLPIFNLIFDIGFGTIQTCVFVLITVIYLSNKIPEEQKIYS